MPPFEAKTTHESRSFWDATLLDVKNISPEDIGKLETFAATNFLHYLGYRLPGGKRRDLDGLWKEAIATKQQLASWGAKIVGESNLKFVVVDNNMHLFPDENRHIKFLASINGTITSLQDAGGVKLIFDFALSEDNQPQILTARRILKDWSVDLYSSEHEHFRNEMLKPNLSQYFEFR